MAAMQSAISDTRRYDDVAMLRLTPEPTAIYAARHAGHLGKSTRITPGSDHRVRASERRTHDGGADILSVAVCAGGRLLDLPGTDWQQELITCLHGHSTKLSFFAKLIVLR